METYLSYLTETYCLMIKTRALSNNKMRVCAHYQAVHSCIRAMTHEKYLSNIKTSNSILTLGSELSSVELEGCIIISNNLRQ